MNMMELIEVDPATDEEYQLLSTGSRRSMASELGDHVGELVANGEDFKVKFRIQAAQ